MSMRHLRFLRYVDEVARAGSIRKAAEQLHVTASAVNRRIMDLEEELGAPLFERRAARRAADGGGRTVRALHPRTDRRRRAHEVADRGSQGHAPRHRAHRLQPGAGARLPAARDCDLPGEIPAGRSFDVKVFDHERAMAALAAYEVDLVLVFRPPFLPNFQPLMSLRQRLVALMPADHPLAARKNDQAAAIASAIRSRSPSAASADGSCSTEVLARLEPALRHRGGVELVRIPARHGAARQGDLVPDRDRRGAESDELVVRQIDDRDVPRADLVLGQLRGRNLPVPAAKFAEQLARVLEGMRE